MLSKCCRIAEACRTEFRSASSEPVTLGLAKEASPSGVSPRLAGIFFEIPALFLAQSLVFFSKAAYLAPAP